MARYTVLNQNTNKKVTFDWNDPNPPTDADMEEVFAAAGGTQTAQTSTQQAQIKPSGFNGAIDKGFSFARPVLNALPGVGTASQAIQAGLNVSPPKKSDIPAIAATAATMGMAPAVGVGIKGAIKLAGIAGIAGGSGKAVEQAVSGKRPSLAGMVAEGGKQAALQAAGSGVAAGITKTAEVATKAAVPAARRALGFIKGQMLNPKSWRESLRKMARINDAAEEMLEKKVIPWDGSPTKMWKKATSILDDSGKQMNKALSTADNAGAMVDANTLASDLIDNLKPEYADQQKVVEALLGDLEVFQKNPTVGAADKLKTRWAKFGYEDRTVGSEASKIYRKASAILEKRVAETVSGVSKEMGDAFKTAKKAYGKAFTAMKGISNKLASEQGNDLMSLPSKVLGAGTAAATGNLPGALAAIGVMEAGKRRGMAFTANALKKAGNVKASGTGVATPLRKLFSK